MDDYVPSWRSFAACANQDEDTAIDFFTADPQEKYKARAMCMSECPVRLECLQHALSQPELFGVWGGVDEFEIRRALSVNKNGEPARRSLSPRCPGCRNRDIEVTKKMRNRSHVKCTECGLKWAIERAPRKQAKVDASLE